MITFTIFSWTTPTAPISFPHYSNQIYACNEICLSKLCLTDSSRLNFCKHISASRPLHLVPSHGLCKTHKRFARGRFNFMRYSCELTLHLLLAICAHGGWFAVVTGVPIYAIFWAGTFWMGNPCPAGLEPFWSFLEAYSAMRPHIVRGRRDVEISPWKNATWLGFPFPWWRNL